MKVFCLIIILLILTGTLSAQDKTVQVPVSRSGDTSYWYSWTREKSAEMGLPYLDSSSKMTHVRFWTFKEVVDIRCSNGKDFEGQVISFATWYDADKHVSIKPKSKKVFHKTYPIDSVSAKRVYDMAAGLGVFQIPSQDSLKAWPTGFDGYENLIEYSTPSQYAFKEYWSPAYVPEVPEAVIIDSVFHLLRSSLSTDTKTTAFIDSLPAGCYYMGGMSIMCKLVNRRSKRMKKN